MFSACNTTKTWFSGKIWRPKKKPLISQTETDEVTAYKTAEMFDIEAAVEAETQT